MDRVRKQRKEKKKKLHWWENGPREKKAIQRKRKKKSNFCFLKTEKKRIEGNKTEVKWIKETHGLMSNICTGWKKSNWNGKTELLFRLATTCFGSENGWGHCEIREVKKGWGREL